MPLNPVVLAPPVILGAGSLDPIGIVNWTAISALVVAWSLGIVVNATGGTPLVALGPVVTGTGGLVPAVPGAVLGVGLAAASLSLDPPGIAHWIAVGTALETWVKTGGCDSSTLIAWVGPLPPVGAVAGVSKLKIPGKADLATAAGATDKVGKAHWDAVAQAISDHLNTLSLVTPSMTNPINSPLIGTGTVS